MQPRVGKYFAHLLTSDGDQNKTQQNMNTVAHRNTIVGNFMVAVLFNFAFILLDRMSDGFETEIRHLCSAVHRNNNNKIMCNTTNKTAK